jgi:hypothetical protein
MVEGIISSMMYFLHCKNLCNYSNLSPPSTTITKKIFEKKESKLGYLLLSDRMTDFFLTHNV